MIFLEERTIRGGKKGQQTAQKNRINEEITAQEVRLIDIDGEQAGIQSLKDAQAMADAAGVDLVEISPNAEPLESKSSRAYAPNSNSALAEATPTDIHLE